MDNVLTEDFGIREANMVWASDRMLARILLYWLEYVAIHRIKIDVFQERHNFHEKMRKTSHITSTFRILFQVSQDVIDAMIFSFSLLIVCTFW